MAMEELLVQDMDDGPQEETHTFDEIEKLENFGITTSDILKLKAGGVHTIVALKMRTKKVRFDGVNVVFFSAALSQACFEIAVRISVGDVYAFAYCSNSVPLKACLRPRLTRLSMRQTRFRCIRSAPAPNAA